MRHVAVAFGTRPEAVKMAPLVQALRADSRFRCSCIVTAQHREMLDQVLAVFGITPDADLDLMRPGQQLADLTARVLTELTPVLRADRPDLVLVQGDTTTVLAASLAAFYEQIAVGHVEAGLRTGDRYNPFPEEINRRLTGRLATLHFAPTDWAAGNLRAEGVAPDSIYLTGNTVIDALQQVAAGEQPWPDDVDPAALTGRRLLLVTAHRRENLGEPLQAICQALRDIVTAEPETALLFAMHRNPAVRQTVRDVLGDLPRVQLIEPPDYFAFVGLMRRATLILTDSGGIQEEAPALGKPVLVLRRTTERPEGVDAGTARLVGTDRAAIVAAALQLLRDANAWRAMAQAVNPYGDGRAAQRIVEALAHHSGLGPRPADFTVTR
ncbi:MAG: UDP-N-acetylglucosamine 2-epimerase (non-hydrolyzing) [Fimbriimonadaceae bacterium]|nr:UDP-N-acetylglucosamine 2-epimerase (non-hydrolyzing) [Fimbriimonadaceae bacterium]